MSLVVGASGAIGARLVPQLSSEVRGDRHLRSPEKAARPARPRRRGSCSTSSTGTGSARPSSRPAGRDRLPGDRARRCERPQELRPELREDEPAPHRGHRRVARRRPRGRRRAEASRAQSRFRWPYARAKGGAVKTEEDPLDPTRPPAMSESPLRSATSRAAVRRRERHPASVRRPLRLPARRAARARPQAAVPDRR